MSASRDSGSKPELGGDDHVFAEGRECFADDLFIDVRAVDLGSVEEGGGVAVQERAR
jgi:hypothetical protein